MFTKSKSHSSHRYLTSTAAKQVAGTACNRYTTNRRHGLLVQAHHHCTPATVLAGHARDSSTQTALSLQPPHSESQARPARTSTQRLYFNNCMSGPRPRQLHPNRTKPATTTQPIAGAACSYKHTAVLQQLYERAMPATAPPKPTKPATTTQPIAGTACSYKHTAVLQQVYERATPATAPAKPH